MKRPCRECKSTGTSRGGLGTCRGTVQNYVFRPNEATRASLFVHRRMDSCPAPRGGQKGRNGPKAGFFKKKAKKVCQLFGRLVRRSYFCTRNSGCSSARLEYASGGRVVAGSNPVTPTELPSSNDSILIESLLLFLRISNAPSGKQLQHTAAPKAKKTGSATLRVGNQCPPKKHCTDSHCSHILPQGFVPLRSPCGKALRRKASCSFVALRGKANHPQGFVPLRSPLVVKLSAARLRVHSWPFVVKPIIRKASCLFVALCGTPQ